MLLNSIKQGMRMAVEQIRHISGDDAYDRYLQHHHQYHCDQPILDRRAFYLAEQQRKWSGVSRCC